MPLVKKNIPFCGLNRQYSSMREEIDKTLQGVLSSGWYILGEQGKCFEQEFAEYCNCSFGIAVASGTEALYLSLLACGIGHGDEVITVSNAGIPTVTAISWAGAVPVFVDSHPKSYNIDVLKIEEKITSKTKLLLPVHLYGQCADMNPILGIAKRHNLKVIEDACQAHGAVYKGRKAGAMGDIGCFSFYPTKNLGAFGDGGMVVTNNESLSVQLRLLRNYGQTQRYHHEVKGINSRMDEIQAAVLRVKLKYLDKWNAKRIELAGNYNDNINNDCIIKPVKMEYGTHVYHLYVIVCKYRDKLIKYLEDNGIQTLIHYPIPAYLQNSFIEFKKDNNICPITEDFSRMVLSLPFYPEIEEDEIKYVISAINKFKIQCKKKEGR